jgi:hypothetical protein
MHFDGCTDISRVYKQLAVLPSEPQWCSNRFCVNDRRYDPSEEWYFTYRLGHRNQHEGCGNVCTNVQSGGKIRNCVLLPTEQGGNFETFCDALLNTVSTARTTTYVTIMKNVEFRIILQECFKRHYFRSLRLKYMKLFLPALLCGSETWSVILREKCKWAVL